MKPRPPITKARTERLVESALARKLVLHATSPAGDDYSAGMYRGPLGHARAALFGQGSSRHLIDEFHGSRRDVATLFVALVGRGNAKRAVLDAEQARHHGHLTHAPHAPPHVADNPAAPPPSPVPLVIGSVALALGGFFLLDYWLRPKDEAPWFYHPDMPPQVTT